MQSFEKRLQHNINLRSHCGCFVWVVALRLQQFERTVAMSMARPWGLSKRNGTKKNEEGFACYGQFDRARRGCAGFCRGSRCASLHQGASDDRCSV